MFGRQATLPVQLSYLTEKTWNADMTADEYELLDSCYSAHQIEVFVAMLDMRKDLHTCIATNINKVQKTYKKGYDECNNTSFKVSVGNQVLLKNKRNQARKGGKMEISFFKDVYIVTKVHDNGNVNVCNSKTGLILEKTFPPDFIKKYLEPISTHMMVGPECHSDDFAPEAGSTPMCSSYPHEPKPVSSKEPIKPLLNITAIADGEYNCGITASFFPLKRGIT